MLPASDLRAGMAVRVEGVLYKEARLESGVGVMVPPFIGPGESIRIEVETGKYVERAKTDRRK